MLAALKHWKLIVIGTLLAALPAVYTFARQVGDSEGYERHQAQIAVNNQTVELERKGDEAKLRSMSDRDLCREYLGARGVPVDACEQL